MKVIVGLGNPGREYAKTRHNAGFWVIEELSARWSIPVQTKKFQAEVGQGLIATKKVLLAKPLTYMNRSGDAVKAICEYFRIALEDVLVIVDDLALPPGMIRLRAKGTAGGHNGLKSIIGQLGSEQFPRLRIGIGEAPSEQTTVSHVLGNYTKDEEPLLRQAVKRAADAAECWLTDGIEEAMNVFNRRLDT